MDAKSGIEAISVNIDAIRSTIPQDELPEFETGLANLGLVAENVGPLATTEALSDTPVTPEVVATPEAVTDPSDLRESLLSGFEAAYNTYAGVVETVNTARAQAKGRKKPEQLAVIDQDTVRTTLEAMLENEAVVAELAADIDHFAKSPESDSPEAGYDVLIVADGLTETDDHAIVNALEARIGSGYTPYIRPESYNDKRERVATGNGFRIVFAPRHYNVPSGTAGQQTEWMKDANRKSTATELQTATDAEALTQATALVASGEVATGKSTNFDATYYRRFDQTPRDGYVSDACVNGNGESNLDLSYVHADYPARALVVPKA